MAALTPASSSYSTVDELDVRHSCLALFSCLPMQFVVDMLCQAQEGFLRLFGAWPSNLTASFTNLRMKGALLVSG